MTRLQQSGLLALLLLLSVAGVSLYFGSRAPQALPVKAAVSLEPEDLLAVRPVPPERRLSAADFLRPSPRHPLQGGDGPSVNALLGEDGPGLQGARPIELDPSPTPGISASRVPSVSSARRIRVRYGDSLRRIARRELGSEARWKEVAVQNGIQAPYTIRQGQELMLPPDPPAGISPVPDPAPGTRHYTVKPGELPTEVSRAVYGDSKYWKLILRHNGIRDARRMRAGQVLEIPPLPR